VHDDRPRIPSAEELAASVSARMREVLDAACRSADEIRVAADRSSELRAREIREAAERDAERLVRRAEQEAREYLEEACRRVEAFAAGRARRIGQAADRLLTHAEMLADRAERAERATRLRRAIDDVVAALSAAAEAIAAEAGRPPISLPGPREPSAEVTRLPPRPRAVPDPEPPAPPTLAPAPAPVGDDDDAGAHVREIARALPRRPGHPPPVRSLPPWPDGPPPGDDAA
jgi:hypothetical protein